MPYKWTKDKTPMPRAKDKRVKLTDQERQEIKDLENVYGAEKTGKMYGVSKRTVQFIRDPAKIEANYQRRKERGGSKVYYDREKHTKAMRAHRRHKQGVLTEDSQKGPQYEQTHQNP